MMTFDYKPTVKEYSHQEKQEAKDYFIKYIGDVRPFFEDNDVSVLINMDIDHADENKHRYTFSSPKIMSFELVAVIEEYRKQHPYS